MIPVIGILAVQAVKDLIEDYGRRKNDSQINDSPCQVFSSSDMKYHNSKWSKLRVGDIVRVTCNSVIPADLLLLHSSDEHGGCFIETSNIDGETNLKQRVVAKQASERNEGFRPELFKSIIECQTPNNEIYKFHGNIIPGDGSDKIPVNNLNLLLRGCVIRNTDYVEGIVVYAGHETKAMLNNNGPRYKRSKLERRMNKDVLYCVAMLIVMCLTGAIGNGIWTGQKNNMSQSELFLVPNNDFEDYDPALSGFYMFWTMVILLQVLIPISLYVSIELVKWMQVYLINSDIHLYHAETDTPMICRALNIPEDLGQIQFVFSDKTGTLTENKMVFKKCTVGGQDYPHAANAARIENSEPTPATLQPNPSKRKRKKEKENRQDRDSNPMKYSYSGGSIRSYHRKSTRKKAQTAFSTDTVRKEASNNDLTATDSPVPTRKMKRQVSTKRPASHHRRNISSVSARELQATIASMNDPVTSDANSSGDSDDESLGSSANLETDVTPDPVLYRHLVSVPFKSLASRRAVDMSMKKERILDFFVNLAICNTVVISNDDGDTTDAGSLAGTPTSIKMKSFDKLKKWFEIAPKLSPLTSPPSQEATVLSVKSLDPSKREQALKSSLSPPSVIPSSNGVVNRHDEGDNFRYEAESPDEAALVYAARSYGCTLAHRSQKANKSTVTISLPTKHRLTFQVLHTLEFDSARKMMSVIVRDLNRSNQIVVYTKGADSAVLERLAPCTDQSEAEKQPGYGGDLSDLVSNSNQVVNQTKKALNDYAHQGLRTLCMAKRVLSEEEYSNWLKNHKKAESSLENREELLRKSYDAIESQFQLLGTTGIEDKLQDGVPETIESLRQAGIQVWVVTGDKQETAINIGYSCKLIHQDDEVIMLSSENREEFIQKLDENTELQETKRGITAPEDEVSGSASLITRITRSNSDQTYVSPKDKEDPLAIVIDGKTLEFALEKDLQKKFVRLAKQCRSVLCCRATPLQKGEVVKLIRDELNVMTLAIGDGANDVSMIQVADVGIGLSGQEGMQAVMSSDYAIAQFRFLRRLLLVHGHWNYQRLASLVLYFFYKNAAFSFLIFWFQIFCGFSGGNMIEQMYLLLFNLTITGLPPLVNGVFDKDLKSSTLLKKPHLYQQGIDDEVYKPRTFWINILDAVYQSLVIFFVIMGAYYDSDVGLIEWGTVVTTASVFVILLHLAIETKTWTWIHWAGQIGSVVGFFAFALIYNIVCPACLPPSNPYYVMERVIQTPKFWLSIVIATVIALLPRYLIRSIQTDFFPTDSQHERVMERRKTPNVRHNSSNSVSPDHTSASESEYSVSVVTEAFRSNEKVMETQMTEIKDQVRRPNQLIVSNHEIKDKAADVKPVNKNSSSTSHKDSVDLIAMNEISKSYDNRSYDADLSEEEDNLQINPPVTFASSQVRDHRRPHTASRVVSMRKARENDVIEDLMMSQPVEVVENAWAEDKTVVNKQPPPTEDQLKTETENFTSLRHRSLS